MNANRTVSATHEKIARAIEYAAAHWDERPGLDTLARVAGTSRHHFARTFRQWAGISPVRFVQCLALDRGKKALASGKSVLDATWEAGLSSPGRLHDLFVTLEAVTPGEFKAAGRGLTVRYGFHETPFGRVLAGATSRGICWLSFCGGKGGTHDLDEMRREWPEAGFVPDAPATAAAIERIFSPGRAAGGGVRSGGAGGPLHLHVRGTNFQVKVWSALLRLPPGGTTTYGDLARAIGRTGAARAVGTAVGANPISVLIPCHRVLRESGALGGYRWGIERKRALLAWESARAGGGEGRDSAASAGARAGRREAAAGSARPA